jgi:hypothetical protein
MGHFCRICVRIRANERFTGKGHRDHVCQECARLPRAVREKIDLLEELSGMLHQSHISAKNQTRLQALLVHPDSMIARAAKVLHELARKYPYRRRRLVRLRRERDFVQRLMTELPPGMWEDYVNRFGDFLEAPYELLPGLDPGAMVLPPEDPGPDPEPDEPIRWEDCEPIRPPVDDW